MISINVAIYLTQQIQALVAVVCCVCAQWLETFCSVTKAALGAEEGRQLRRLKHRLIHLAASFCLSAKSFASAWMSAAAAEAAEPNTTGARDPVTIELTESRKRLRR